MHKKYIKKIFLTFLILVFGLLFRLQNAKAIGVAPASVNFEDMVNGQKKEVQMTLMRTDPQGDVHFNISASGEAGHFIVLPKDNFVLPDGESRGTYSFYINPVGAANGRHAAFILFSQAAGDVKTGQTGAGMSIGVGTRVTFSITDHQIKLYGISDPLINMVEEGEAPILNFYIKNDGNVEVKPDKIAYTIIDVTDRTNIKTGGVGGDDLEFTPPWEFKKNSVKLSEGMPVGKYKTNIDFYDGGAIKQSFKDLALEVVPKGTLQQSGEFFGFKLNGDKFAPNDLLKFDAQIHSNGEGTIEPILYIEIKLNGKTVDLLKSDKKTIPRDQSANYVTTYRLSENGDYEADAYFEYGIKQTDHKKINFSIGNFESKRSVTLIGGSSRGVLAAVVGAVFALLAVVGWFIKKFFL